MRTSIIFFAVVYFIASEGALAADLNTPLNDKPTIGSEMRRGASAAFNCSLQVVATDDDMLSCVLSVATADEQRHPNFDPFELGLYYGACVIVRTGLQSDENLAPTNEFAAAKVPTDRSNLAALYTLFRNKQRLVGATDAQVVASETDMTAKSHAEMLAQLKLWAQSPPAASGQ